MKLMPWRNKSREESGEISAPSLWEPGSFLSRFFDDPWALENFGRSPFGSWMPPVDITESDKEVMIRSEIPGVDPKELSITVSGDVLTLSGEKSESHEKKEENYYHAERRFGSFRRRIELPAAVDAEKVNAEYENGVLTVKLQKTEDASVKRIPVSVKK